MSTPREEVLATVRRARGRLRVRQAVQGLSRAAAGIALVVLASSWAVEHFHVAPEILRWIRWLAAGGAAGLLLWLVVRPWCTPVSDKRVALYLEEHLPQLDMRLASAVECAGESSGTAASAVLAARLLADAADRCAALGRGRRVERAAVMRSGGLLAGTLAAWLGLAVAGPASLKRGMAAVFSGGAGRPSYRVAIYPQDTVVARGGDLEVRAVLQGFGAERVELAVRRGDGGEWERFPMVPDSGEGEAAYGIVLLGLTEAAEYFAEAGGVRSPAGRVRVADVPRVQNIALEYRFPRYTGLPPRRVEAGGDIAALRGTVVRLEVTPTLAPARAWIVIGGPGAPDTVGLAPDQEGRFAGLLTVERAASYHVAFEAGEAGVVVGSPEYAIDVLADQPPAVRFRAPGRDLPVTPVEEVFTEAEAQDDYGVAHLELRYRINGGPERAVALGPAAGPRRIVVGSHTFFLEEEGLSPGDLISYYARAVEVERPGGGQQATSDIYFLKVRPFERAYRAADSRPAMSGSAGAAGSAGDLSRRQREIVAGTFNLLRDSAAYAAGEYREHLATLALAQGRLREDVSGLVERMRNRGVSVLDSSFRVVTEALDAAVGQMQQAEEQLGGRRPAAAMPAEERALQQLQRAEAAYREIRVGQGSGAAGGAGGAAARAEDLADLFGLEMDKLGNQYEEVERGRRQAADAELDEALERLRELARRQQQENERLRARLEQLARGAAAGGSSAQRNLAEQAEELARRLERLSREPGRPELTEVVRRLREAAQAMRRAAGQTGSEGTSGGRAALDQLRRAQESLEREESGRLERDVSDLIQRAERLAEQERQVQRELAGLTGEPGGDAERIRRMDERKEAMAAGVQGVEQGADRLAREFARAQPDAARRLAEAAEGIRDSKLREKILYSRGVIRGRSPEYARNFEEQIAADVEALRQRLDQARGAVGEPRARRLARIAAGATDLATALESLSERLRDAAAPARRGAGPPGATTSAAGGPSQAAAGGDRRFEVEWRQRLRDAERLREDLRAEGVDVRELDRVLGTLGGLGDRLRAGDRDAVNVLANEVVPGLKEFEFLLRRRFALEQGEQPAAVGLDGVPEPYRKLVEEYYKVLSGRPK